MPLNALQHEHRSGRARALRRRRGQGVAGSARRRLRALPAGTSGCKARAGPVAPPLLNLGRTLFKSSERPGGDEVTDRGKSGIRAAGRGPWTAVCSSVAVGVAPLLTALPGAGARTALGQRGAPQRRLRRRPGADAQRQRLHQRRRRDPLRLQAGRRAQPRGRARRGLGLVLVQADRVRRLSPQHLPIHVDGHAARRLHRQLRQLAERGHLQRRRHGRVGELLGRAERRHLHRHRRHDLPDRGRRQARRGGQLRSDVGEPAPQRRLRRRPGADAQRQRLHQRRRRDPLRLQAGRRAQPRGRARRGLGLVLVQADRVGRLSPQHLPIHVDGHAARRLHRQLRQLAERGHLQRRRHGRVGELLGRAERRHLHRHRRHDLPDRGRRQARRGGQLRSDVGEPAPQRRLRRRPGADAQRQRLHQRRRRDPLRLQAGRRAQPRGRARRGLGLVLVQADRVRRLSPQHLPIHVDGHAARRLHRQLRQLAERGQPPTTTARSSR